MMDNVQKHNNCFLVGLFSVEWNHAIGEVVRMGVYKSLMQLLTCITDLQSIQCSLILCVFTLIPNIGIYDNILFGSQVNCCWPSPAVNLGSEFHKTDAHILLSHDSGNHATATNSLS
jgi:hypothetical protein